MATMTTLERLPFTLEIRLANKPDGSPGDLAQVDGVPVYTSSDDAVMKVVAEADGMSGFVEGVAAGVAFLNVSADADLGAGVSTITDRSDDVGVLTDPSLLAAKFGITFGAAVPKA